MANPPHYNKNYLRGRGDTDQETLANLKKAKPGFNVSEMTCQTPGFVPALIKEMERLETINLQSLTNAKTGMLFTEKEAKGKAHANAKGAYNEYKQLLDQYKRRA